MSGKSVSRAQHRNRMPISPELMQEILACLHRSGYLLESRLVQALCDARFFVEPNVALIDSRTGKSREIDLLAEYYEYNPDLPNVSVRTEFAIEATNNALPLVLMTPHPGSPITDIEAYVRYRTTPEPAPFETRVDVYEEKGVFKGTRYSQYCALSRKKGSDELIALHTDDLYSDLLKLAELIEQRAAEFEARAWPSDDPFWRLWFWQGVLVVGGDLLVVTEDSGGIALAEIEDAPLVFNFHSAEQPTTVVIQVLRERTLIPYVKNIIAEDRLLASLIYEVRHSQTRGAT